ncbi:S8 family serine peptidase [Moheibacter sediminis]|uniref:Por secretion system C-terminal sorting domain-containing protein n=1 Tax=Moheibacter sediminis TaxID=1434700 RepID=A0A1W2D031_9FLAO|nr:S8 family serine peptidase [Moheibacter sediminis]SMC90909.1 Por secretion system C-terminal sorting domain-containing protein [Moheibacter sediminis]
MDKFLLKAGIILMLVAWQFAGGQTLSQKQQITDRYDLNELLRLQNEYHQNMGSERERVRELAGSLNIPLIVEENGTYKELQKILPDGSLIYYITFNVGAARSTRTNHLNAGGSLGLNLMGQNMTAHIWDGGLARTTHQEYDGAGGTDRFTIGDGTTAMHYHAAHVTGTIIASGLTANAKGMAPHAKAIGYDWNNDLTEATSAAANGMLISNHSYGFDSSMVPDYYFGAYITDSRDWDNLLFNAPYYLMVVAAGNDGSTNYNGAPLGGNSAYDKLTGHSTSKNNLVVANANDANVDNNGNLISVTINSSSSEGPTDDYRIKPDITGNGTSVYSTYETSNTAYGTLTGTSMASPNVAGSLLLLQQHYNNLNSSFMRASTLKGLVLHTADDAGSAGPDAIFGWGLLNAKRAAETITNKGNGTIMQELTLTGGQTYQFTVDSDGVNELRASISWTDRPGTATTQTNSTTPKLVNDLDLRITKGSTTFLPWKLTGITTNGKVDNNLDPFERVDVSGASGTYTVTVSHKGSLTGGSQNYSLIITGVSAIPVQCEATTPTGLAVNGVGSSTASLSWTAVTGTSYDFRYRLVGASTWITSSETTTSKSLSGLASNSQYEAQVRSKCDGGATSAYSASVNFTTTQVQTQYCGSASTNTNDEYIQRVQLNTINNPSGAQFYSDFTNLSTNLSKSQAYTITITPKWNSTSYNEGYAVWIDYNKDGDFTDSGELVWSRTPTNAATVSGTFTIPANAVDGPTRMRVSMKYNAVPNPCETFTYGEVEDYTIIIGGTAADTQAPTAPANLTASNIAQTSLTLNWTASSDNVGVTGYDIFSGSTNIGTVTGTTANVTGLTVNTAYSFSVKAKDAVGNVSSSSNVLNVTTLAANSQLLLTITFDNYPEETSWRILKGSTIVASGGTYGSQADGSTLNIPLNLAPDCYTLVFYDAYGDGMCCSYGNGSYSLKQGTTVLASGGTFSSSQSTNFCTNQSNNNYSDYASTNTDETQNHLKLYPNPVKDILNVSLNGFQAQTYQVVDMHGRVLMQGMYTDKLDVSRLETGTYVLKLMIGEKSKTERFIKR